MIPIIRHHQYTCGLLEEADIPAFLCFNERRVEEEISLFELDGLKAERYRERHTIKGAHAVSVRQEHPKFCLYHHDHIVGITAISITGHVDHPDYELSGFKILPSYTRKNLSRMLYDASIRFLLTETDASFASVRVNKKNTPSNKAALRNGFTFYTQSTDPLAGTYILYNLDLLALRNEFSSEFKLEPKP